MGRHSLSTVMALGAVISLIGGAGLFAVFTDRATTGDNAVTSSDRTRAADLQIAEVTNGFGEPIVCGTFSDDLQTGLFTVPDLQPDQFEIAGVCLRNAGALALDLTTTVVDLVDLETGCTGDEVAFGDATCGSGLGELSSVLRASLARVDCATGVISGGSSATIHDLASLSVGAIFTAPLDPGETGCLSITIGVVSSINTEEAMQIAQSDQATWRFAFDGSE